MLVVDWLRGLAVVLMIVAHGYDAWLTADARTRPAYDLIRHASGLPSRLFLFLVGVSAAIKFEGRLAKGTSRHAVRMESVKRGVSVIAMAYAFRFQEWALSGFWPGLSWTGALQLARVDILNCIGTSLIVVSLIALPRTRPSAGGKISVHPRWFIALGAAALLVGFGPTVGLATFPSWMPRPLTSYIGGQRPMAWFTLFPWGAWALVGLVVGHFWLRFGRTARTQALVFIGGGVLGAAITAAVNLVRELDPHIIHYPSNLAQQLGTGAFFFRFGIIGVLAAIGWVVTKASGDRHSPLRQLGQTSLFIYWIHVDLCYGHLAKSIKTRLTIPEATTAVFALIVAMYGVSVLKTRYGAGVWTWVRGLVRRRLRGAQTG